MLSDRAKYLPGLKPAPSETAQVCAYFALSAALTVGSLVLAAKAALPIALFALAAAAVTDVEAVMMLRKSEALADFVADPDMGIEKVSSADDAPNPELKILYEIIEGCLREAGISNPLTLLVNSDKKRKNSMGIIPNRGKAVVTVMAGSEIMKFLKPAQIRGVMFHEIGHQLQDMYYEVRAGQFLSVARWATFAGFAFLAILAEKRGERDVLKLSQTAWAFAMAYAGKLCGRGVSRVREYQADRYGITLNKSVTPLLSALFKIVNSMINQSGPLRRMKSGAVRKAGPIMKAGSYLFWPYRLEKRLSVEHPRFSFRVKRLLEIRKNKVAAERLEAA